ncbi:MAG: hypothetical protein HFE81_03530 [Bacilli bacterium]|nr:hypothetical protein [Bacilli bacterium]
MTLKRTKIKLGRKLKYKTAEELEKHIKEYFKYCQHERLIPGICGLANHLGITRTTLLNYENNSELADYNDVVQRAKTTIEAYNEQILYCKNNSGAQFVMKNNFGWNAEQKTHNVNENIDIPYEEYLKEVSSNEVY